MCINLLVHNVYVRRYLPRVAIKRPYIYLLTDYGFIPKKAKCVVYIIFSIYVFMVPNLLDFPLFLLFLSKEYMTMKPVTLMQTLPDTFFPN